MNTTTTHEKVAANVRQILEENDYKAADLAKQIEVTPAQAYRLLRGDSRMKFEHLKTVGDWLNVDPRRFLGLPVADSETWLTLRESSAFAARHPETLRKAIRAGDLPSHQRVTQGMHLIRKSDLDAWIAGVR